jgi:uncharacterized membrane protein YfcA
VGIVLGLLGGGGSILAVPIFLFAFRVSRPAGVHHDMRGQHERVYRLPRALATGLGEPARQLPFGGVAMVAPS